MPKLLIPALIKKSEVNKFVKEQNKEQHIKPDLIKDAGLNHVKALFKSSASNDVQFKDDGSIVMGAITLDDSQAQAINGLLGSQFGALIGSAGTGKTTVVKALISLLERQIKQEKGEDYKPIFLFAAYTARAKNVMSSKIPQQYRKDCYTVHKALDYRPIKFDNGEGGFTRIFKPARCASNLIVADCIVIDESGMLNYELWHEILESVDISQTRIYLVGDIAQLPPIMGMSPLPIAMLKAPCFELKKVHRQALNSPIIAAATAIKEGFRPVNGHNEELNSTAMFIPLDASDRRGIYDPQIFKTKFLKILKDSFERGNFNPWTDIILTPVAKQFGGKEATTELFCSAASLNAELRMIFNPATEKNPRIIVHGSPHALNVSTIGLGDKLMITRNSVQENMHPSRSELSVNIANGMLARVTDIRVNPAYEGGQTQLTQEMILKGKNSVIGDLDLDDLDADDVTQEQKEETYDKQCSHIVTIEIIGEENAAIELKTAGDFSNLLYGYAITVYKAQGGEYRNVVICLQRQGTSRLNTREMLYTAVTRASLKVVVLHDVVSLGACLKNATLKGVTVKEKAENIMLLCQRKEEDKIPKMPNEYVKTYKTWVSAN